MPRRFLNSASWNKFRPAARRLLRSRYGKRRGFRGVRRRRTYTRKTSFRARRFRKRRVHRVRRRKGTGSRRSRFIPLTRYQVFKAVYGQEQQNSTWSGGFPRCLYFTAEHYLTSSTMDTVPTLQLNGNYHLAKIADLLWINTPIVSQGGASNNLTTMTMDINSRLQFKSKVEYVIRAASTEYVDFEMFVCRARKNINFTNYLSGTTNPATNINVYNHLSLGFAQNGLDPNNTEASLNAAMRQLEFTPFQSTWFCENFKILRSKKFRISGGNEKRFVLKTRPFLFKPKDYFTSLGGDSAATWQAANHVYCNNKFERFILFRMCSRVQGSGAAFVSGHSQVTSNTNDVYQMNSFFTYMARAMKQPKTPFASFDTYTGFATVAGGNTIINAKTHAPTTVTSVT